MSGNSGMMRTVAWVRRRAQPGRLAQPPLGQRDFLESAKPGLDPILSG